ncbi:MAG: AAC(3) family N-acetyltransferase [bacterium]
MIDEVTEIIERQNIVNELANSWNQSGIDKGDTVMVHSSLSGFLKKYKSRGMDLTPEDVLNSFIASVGDKGTLIFPTFNFDFAKGKVFDIRNTKSETGALSEAARNRRDSVRTGHPMFSFAVIGFHIDKFRDLYNYNAFGKESPFAKLLELDGKIAVLDVPGEICMTFHHYVEEMENAPNRFHKTFKGRYIDHDGNENEKEFNVYSRILEDGVVTDIKQMVDHIRSKGLFTGSPPGEGSCLNVIKAKKVYEEVSKVIRAGKALGMLYRIEKNS